MYPQQPLSQTSQGILAEMVSYHTTRLEAWEREREAKQRLKDGAKPFSLSRAILGMASGSMDAAERNLLEKAAALAGVHFDAQRIFLPWALLQPETRDLTVASAGSGGYLVATSYGAARDTLRGWSVALSAGITVIDGLVGDMAIPRITTAPTGYALATETTTITESQPVIGQVAFTPKNLACFCEFSRLLAKQAAAETVVKMILLSTLGKFLDTQILNGSGASGEMTGILNTAGLQTQSGTSLAQAGVTVMKQKAAEAGAVDRELGFISTPAVRQLLEIREKVAGNAGFIWQGGQVADLPAFASVECPAATMLVGPWAQVILGMWGAPGLMLEINPFDPTGFKAGVIQGRMILTADVGVIRPSAFVKSTSIT